MTDRRAIIIDYEVPSERPVLHVTPAPQWERFLPWKARARRYQKRFAAAVDDQQRRISEWEAAGRPPTIHRIYSPSADVKATPLPNGDTSVTVTPYPRNAEIRAYPYPKETTR